MTETPSVGSVYLLDAHGLIFQMFHAIGPMTAPDGRPTNAVFGVTRALMSLYDKGADYLIAALDSAGPTFRDHIADTYKAHREPPPDDLLLQEPMITQVMEGMRIPFVAAPGYEADDIMATVAREGAARGLEVFICSSDKDLRQVLSDKVKILNLRKGDQIDADTLMKDWCVKPEQVIDFQSLVGDSVDNVPGVPGVGPKTAAKWLQQFGTLDSIITNADNVPGGPKTRQALKDAIANGNLAKSKRLVTLDTRVPIEIDWQGWKRRDWDGQRLLELFHEFGFRGFAERVRRSLQTASPAAPHSVDEPRGLTSRPSSTPQPEPNEFHKRRPSEPSLFDAIYENPAEAEFAFGANVLDPDWKSDYRLVDTSAALESFLAELKQQKRFVFDLKTTHTDPIRAEIVGYAFSWKPEHAYYLPVRGPKEDRTLDASTVLRALKPLFEDAAVVKVSQNIKYDLLVLRGQGVTLVNAAGDPMIAHYLLHSGERSHNLDDLARSELKHENIKIESLIGKGKKQLCMSQVPTDKLTDHACEDADVALRLAEKLEEELNPEPAAQAGGTAQTLACASGSAKLLSLYRSVELPLIEVLAELEFNGVRLDMPFLARLSKEMEGQLAEIERDVHKLAGREFNLGSPKQLRDVLYADMNLPVRKRTDTTGEASTDQETLERLAALGFELPKKIIEHRQIAKLKGTYVDALPALVNPKTGRLHTSFNQTVATTGRLSSSDPNLQNIPARTEQGRQVRQAFLPPDDWVLVTADYSQVELRLLAHFCQDEALAKAFADDRDVHAMVAAEIFRVPEADVTSEQRRVAKTVNFGVIYGMSGIGLALRLGIDKKDANRFIDEYFQRYPKVLEYQQRLLAKCRETGRVETILGRRRNFDPNSIRSWTTYQRRNMAEREAINMEIQGSAADLMKLAMLGVHRGFKQRGFRAKMLLTVHDELVLETPPEELQPVAELVRREMTTALKLDVPLKVDIAAGKNWLEVEDVPA
jgi:DNA polymerase I